jgi:hypothetical protein
MPQSTESPLPHGPEIRQVCSHAALSDLKERRRGKGPPRVARWSTFGTLSAGSCRGILQFRSRAASHRLKAETNPPLSRSPRRSKGSDTRRHLPARGRSMQRKDATWARQRALVLEPPGIAPKSSAIELPRDDPRMPRRDVTRRRGRTRGGRGSGGRGGRGEQLEDHGRRRSSTDSFWGIMSSRGPRNTLT